MWNRNKPSKTQEQISVHWLINYISLSKRLNQHRSNTLISSQASLWNLLRAQKCVYVQVFMGKYHTNKTTLVFRQFTKKNTHFTLLLAVFLFCAHVLSSKQQSVSSHFTTEQKKNTQVAHYSEFCHFKVMHLKHKSIQSPLSCTLKCWYDTQVSRLYRCLL